MLKIIEFAFTAYSVTDVKRARAFHEGVLNLKPATTFGNEEGQWIEYEVGPHTLAITNMNPDWKPSCDGGGVALEVENFDEAIASLNEAGVKFYWEPNETPVCHMCLISDPDGNSICIHK